MKKTLLLCLSLLTVVISLLVSCSVEQSVPVEEQYAYVEFDESIARDFSAAYTPYSYSDLYWYYTAKKTDGLGTYGATNGETAIKSGKGLEGTIGPFSQGEWEFELSAYTLTKDISGAELVYKTREAIKVTLTGNTTTKIKASVEPQQKTGSIEFKDAYFEYAAGGTSAPGLELTATRTDVVNGSSYTFSTKKAEAKETNNFTLTLAVPNNTTCSITSSKIEGITAGIYKCVARAYFESGTSSIELGTSTFYFAVYGGATTTISGSLKENASAVVEFDVPEQVIQTLTIPQSGNENAGKVTFGNTGLDTSKSPESTKISDTTKVELDLSGIMKTSTDNQDTTKKEITAVTLTTEVVTGAEAQNSFVVKDEGSSELTEDSKTAIVGSISLSAKTQTGDEIGKSTESNKNGFGTSGSTAITQTVTVYVGTGLNGRVNYSGEAGEKLLLKIYYNGAEEADNIKITAYNAESGYLTFTTTHFSTFVVVDASKFPVSVKAEDGTETYYESLAKAFEEVKTKETITLKKSIENIPNGISKTLGQDENITLDLGDEYYIATGSRPLISIEGTDGTITMKGSGKQTTAIVRGVRLVTEEDDENTLNGVYYPDLSSAYTAASEDKGNTLKLYGTVFMNGSNSFKTLDKNIVLDLNGNLLATTSNTGTNTLEIGEGKKITVKNAINENQAPIIKGFKVGEQNVDGVYYATLQKALTGLGEEKTIRLTGKTDERETKLTVCTDYIDINREIEIDLNGMTLVASPNGKTFVEGTPVGLFRLQNESNLTVKNGTIESTSTNSTTNEDYQAFRIRNDESGDSTGAVNAKLTLDKVTLTAPCGITIKEHANGVNLNVLNSTIYYAEGGYGISTNAAVKTSEKVEVNISDSKILLKESERENQDTTGLLINVPATVTLTNAEIEGQRQGAILRGGTYTIENSTFRSTGTKTDYYNSGDYLEGNWSSGNEVPLAAIVIGNRSGSYQYATKVTFVGSNTLEHRNENDVRKDLYVYQNDSTHTVTVDGSIDKNWSVNGDRNGAYYPDAVAKVGNSYYPTLEEAIEKAEDNETITLLGDADLTNTVEISDGNSYIVELNGKTIKGINGAFIVRHGKIKFVGSGTITYKNDVESAPIIVYGSTDSGESEYSVVTVGKDVVLKGWNGLQVQGTDAYDGNRYAYGVKVTLEGKIIASSTAHPGLQGVYVNGLIKAESGNIPELNLKGTEIESTDDGVYAAGYAKWILDGATINAEGNGVSVTSGEVTIKDCIITVGSGESYQESSGGSISSNRSSAVYVKQHSYNPTVKVTVESGTFSGYIPFRQDRGQATTPTPEKITLSITGGKFTCSGSADSVSVKSENKTGFVTGGTFNTDPTTYLGSGYKATKSGSTWTVSKN